MSLNTQLTPVVVGVGDIINRSLRVEDAIEPLDLMLSAIKRAIQDTGTNSTLQKDLQSIIDSLDIVLSWTWPYADLPTLLANRLNVKLKHKFTSPHGGNQSAKLFDDAAKKIALGQATVAVVVGGEALASRRL
jgi:hypothetical protein